MPELPEVETIKNELTPHIIGRTVTNVTLFWEGIVRQPTVTEFRSRLIGREITGVTRRGKYLLVSLNSHEWLIIHLKMSGALLVRPDSSEPPRFTRAIIHLDNSTRVFFRDPRKFGLMRLVRETASIVGKLGPEPLEPGFTSPLLSQRLNKRSAPLKALLCDQKVIAGIGNMYADETLFLARIHPLRAGGNLSPKEIKCLHRAIRQVLQTAIKNKGASIENYLRPDETPGTAHLEFMVARQPGKPCSRCGEPIERITVRNRGTYFCPECQKENDSQ
jgi:formamidopyrimidine-DNA glycosylase|tara:strand:+ start:6237 stop:7064 length:828 start_codon:yes stop_codon:yes gene_type:complete